MVSAAEIIFERLSGTALRVSGSAGKLDCHKFLLVQGPRSCGKWTKTGRCLVCGTVKFVQTRVPVLCFCFLKKVANNYKRSNFELKKVGSGYT